MGDLSVEIARRMDIPAAEALVQLDLPKNGDPPEDWTPSRALVGAHTMDFGVTESDGARIRGLSVKLEVRQGKAAPYEHWEFGLFLVDPGRPTSRVFQLSINKRFGIPPTAHSYPHEHVGDAPRRALPDEWSTWTFDDAFRHFFRQIKLSCPPIPHPGELRLKP